jgi:hypothetical protein
MTLKRPFILLGFVATVAIVPAAACRAESFRPPGDVTGDLRVTVEDAIVALRIVARLRNYSADEKAALDVAPAKGISGRNWGDGQITIADVSRLLRRSVGAEPDPWPGGPAFVPSTRQFQQELVQAGSPYPLAANEGIKVTGKLLDAKNQPLVGDLYFWNAARLLLAKTTSDATGTFTFSGPVGLYQISTVTEQTYSETQAELKIAQGALGTVNVASGIGPIGVQRPALPKVSRVTGTLSQVPEGYVPTEVQFVDLERQFEVAPPPTVASAPVNAKTLGFTAFLPNGTYRPLVMLNRKDGSGSVAALPDQSVPVVTDRTLTLRVPALGGLTGKFTLENTSNATGRILARARIQADRGGGATGSIVKGVYTLPLQTNVGHEVVFLPDTLNPAATSGNELGWVETDVSVTGNNKRDLLLPAPPTTHRIQAWIGDTLGRPVPRAQVSLESTRIYNVPFQYVQMVDAAADQQGVVNLNIPDGVYNITLAPSGDLPSVITVDSR